jgi:hypothetical protein
MNRLSNLLYKFRYSLNLVTWLFQSRVSQRKLMASNGKKLLSLKLVARTRISYQWVGYRKPQTSFQGFAIYGHQVLMSLQTRANFLGTHSTMSVTVSVITYVNITWYLAVTDNLYSMFSQWKLNEIAVKTCCVFVNESWSRRPSFSTSYNEFLLADSRNVLLSYHFAVKSPRYCSGETQEEKYSLPWLLESSYHPNLTWNW